MYKSRNNASQEIYVRSGSGIFVLLTAVFAAAKLFKYGDEMSWWFVFSPLWAPFVLFLCLFLLFAIIMFLYAVINELVASIKRKSKTKIKK